MQEPVIWLGAAAVGLAAAAAVIGVWWMSFDRGLTDLRARLDALVDEQRDVPRALAESSAIQARSLADVRERLGVLGEATRRLESLGNDMSDLHRLLHVPKLRGTQGELWLAELLRELLPSSAYTLEHAYRSGERVDAVIRLRDRLIPVDAKFPLEAFERMFAAEGAAADRERRAFGRTMRDRVDEIAAKYIRPDEGTFEFALMYVPAERVYYETVMRPDAFDPGVGSLRYALDHKVIPVSPTTFYAYLSALAHGLRGLEVERHAQAILDALGALEQEFTRFREAFGVMGRHLTNAAKQYTEAERGADAIGERLRGIGRGKGGDVVLAASPPGREEP
ncbi:MAG TPA: DNA recombination protein RmuC [Gemmatimonadales bacterium]